jgi:hypothetical protein
MDKIEGFLEVGYNESGEVVINHPDLKPDEHGVGHIVFSPAQARNLADLLRKHATIAENDVREKREVTERAKAEAIPVDRSKRCMLSGNPETDDHRKLRADGMQKDYVVLCPEERAKGFVRPVRHSYRHSACGSTTMMSRDLAETYARDPKFYDGTFCAVCRSHYPLDQFTWAGTTKILGS